MHLSPHLLTMSFLHIHVNTDNQQYLLSIISKHVMLYLHNEFKVGKRNKCNMSEQDQLTKITVDIYS